MSTALIEPKLATKKSHSTTTGGPEMSACVMNNKQGWLNPKYHTLIGWYFRDKGYHQDVWPLDDPSRMEYCYGGEKY